MVQVQLQSQAQFGQDLHVINNIYKKKRDGFFVDIGANNGITDSNSYLLEKEFEWKGVCVECNPRLFRDLCKVRLSINYDYAAFNEDDLTLEFYDCYDVAYHGHGSLLETNEHAHLSNRPIIQVNTKTLTSILDEAGAPLFIEFLSLDTEGSEFEILNAHDFDKYIFGYICVEHNFIEKNRHNIRELLLSKGYVFYRQNGMDDDYIHSSQHEVILLG